MSNVIDSRVVEMRFDNRQFESGVATTMSSLDSLNRKLNMTGATKGMENIDAAARKINLSGIGDAVDKVGLKFNALYSMADQALRNITNSAINYGKRIASALTIQPITTGLQEYETQINSVQTILANTESKGTTLSEVNNALDILNKCADKTIYNFTEMTRNIGKFTAAGVDLDTSVNAIQGIANLAAVSGSNSQQASTAMYQLSQAMASGTVKLMDWNSVVNAGMGGQVFQDALKETARVHGIAVDDIIKKTGSFRESLKEGWITTDILTETLSHFTMAAEEGSEEWEGFMKTLKSQGYSEEQAKAILKMSNTATDAATKVKTASQLFSTLKETAQSGWAQTWELIFGDFEGAKTLFSDLYETFAPILESSAKARNELLGGVMSSNWDKMIAKINEAGITTEKFEEKLRSTMETHGIDVDKLVEEHGSLEEAFRNGAVSTDILKEALTNLEGKLLDLSDIKRDLSKGDTGEDVKKVQQALADLDYDLGKWGVDGIIGSKTEAAIKEFQKANGLKVTGIVDEETIKALEEASGKTEGLTKSVSDLIGNIDKLGGRELLFESLMNIFEAIKNVLKPIKDAFNEIFPPLTVDRLYSMIEGFRDFTAKLKLSDKASENIKRTFKGIFAIINIVTKVAVALAKLLTPVLLAIGGLFLEITSEIGDWIVALNDAITKSDFFNKAIEKVRSTFERIKEFFQPLIDDLKKFGQEVGRVGGIVSDKVEERFAPLVALGNILKKMFSWIGAAIKAVFPAIYEFGTAIDGFFKNFWSKICTAIENADYNTLFDILNSGILSAIGIFIAKFIKNAGDIVGEGKGIIEKFGGILDGVKESINAFTKSIQADTFKKIATAILILAAALLVIAFIPSDKLTLALAAITAFFVELKWITESFSKLENTKELLTTTKAIKKLATAMLILAVAFKIMGSMSWEQMGVALISMSVGLGTLVAAVWALSKVKDNDLNKSVKAIKKLATSLIILGLALKIMGSMSWEQMGVALISMASGLGIMIGTLWALPKDAAAKAGGLIILAMAMILLGSALKIMSTMSWEQMGVALVSMAAGLSLLIGTIRALPKDTAAKAGGMIILAVAMILLGSALKIMASMSWEEMGRGLAVLAVSLGAMLATMHLAKGAVAGAAAVLVMAAALTALVPVLLIFGSMSWESIGKSLLVLAGAFVVFGAAAAVLKPLAGTMVKLAGAFALFGVGCLAIGAGILMVGVGLMTLAGALASGGAAIVSFVSDIIGLIPYLIEQVGVGIVALCQVIGNAAGAICDAVKKIILAVLDMIVTIVPEIVNTILTVVPELAEGLLSLITTLLGYLVEYAPQIVPLIAQLIIAVFESLVKYVSGIVQAVFTFIGAIIDAVASNIMLIIQPLANLLGTIVQGIANVIGPVIESVIAPLLGVLVDLLVGLFDSLAPYMPQILATTEKITSLIVDSIVRITEVLAPFIPVVTKMITDITAIIVDSVVRITEAIAPYIPDITQMITEITTVITDAIVKITETLTPHIPVITKMITDITTVVTNAIVEITNTLAPFLPDLKEIILGITESVTTLLEEISPTLDSINEIFNTLKETVDTVFDGIVEVISTVGDTISEDLNALQGLFETPFNGIKGILEESGDFIQKTLDGISGVIDSIGTAALNAGTGFEKLANGISIITGLKLVDMAASLAAVATGVGDIAAHSSGLEQAGTGMKNLAAGISGCSSSIGYVASNVGVMVSGLSNAETAVTSLVTSFTTAKDNLSGIGDQLMAGVIKSIIDKTTELYNAGSEAVTKFIAGIVETTATTAEKCTELADACVKAISSKDSVFITAGKHLVSGFAMGISANTFMAAARAKAMAKAAADAAKKELDEHSPSKVGYGIGDYFGIAFVNGIADNIKSAYNVSTSLASSAKDALNNAIGKISDSINSDIDAQPTIRPVLDLSNVQSGARAINGLLGMDTALGVRANISAISSMMSARGQNGSNDDVVSAIDKLNKKMDNMGNTTYQINGVTYDDGSNINDAVATLVRAARIERRV